MLAGLPVLANDLGAPAERIRAAGFGVVAASLDAVVDALTGFARAPESLEPLRARALAFRHPSVAESAARVADLYAGAGLLERLRDAALPSAADLAALAAAVVHGDEPAPGPDAPAARYQGSALYPLFRAVKRMVPARLRRAGRDLLLRRELGIFQVVDPAALRPDEGLERRASRPGEASFRVLAPGALLQADLALPSIRTRRLLLRLLWTADDATEASARLFFAHVAGEPFSLARSIELPLAAPGAWQDYVLRLDTPPLASLWTLWPTIARLGLAPLDARGEVSVGPLSFGEA